jgi:ribosome maturation factor RimP
VSEPAPDDLLRLVEPAVRAAGLDLEDVRLSRAGRRRRLRILVDKDGGVTLDECAELSRAVGAVLDADDPFGPDPYLLEVSSPGVSRPLREPRHWRRNVGRLVRVDRPGQPSLVGRITAAGDASARLDVAGRPVDIAYREVARAVVQIEFNRPEADEALADEVAADQVTGGEHPPADPAADERGARAHRNADTGPGA